MKHSIAPIHVVGAVLLLGSLATAARAATVLHDFTGGISDGASPAASLTLSGSTLYGMTHYGGSAERGTIFRMNTDGTDFSLLHSFTDTVSDGAGPYDSLTLSGSTLYGMTAGGGSNSGGVIFRMNTDGTDFGLLHTFGGPGDGDTPFGSLTLSGSKLYGMTSGTEGVPLFQGGTIFSINTDGTGYSQLHTFQGNGDPQYGDLTFSGSTLYGMTYFPSSTIFRMNTDGSGFGLLHSFGGGTNDGHAPIGQLTLSGSKLFGMTHSGGSSNRGVIFSIDTDGTGFSLLHSFAGGVTDGAGPYGALTLVGSTLYGMTSSGGSNASGTIFSINTDGTDYQLLESFGGAPADGATPIGDLTLSGDGLTFYGMTHSGGAAEQGVVFSRAVPEPGAFALLGLGAFLLAARRRNARA